MTNEILTAVVHLGSRSGNGQIYTRSAFRLGKYLTKQGIRIIYGGSLDGCMGQVAEGALRFNGHVTGVMPTYTQWQMERQHPKLTNFIKAESMSHRKKVMTDESHMAFVLPGGLGTYDELFEYATATQLRDVMTEKDYEIRIFRPIGLLNINNYFAGLIQQLDKGVEEGFIDLECRATIMDAPTPAKLLYKLRKAIKANLAKEKSIAY